MYRIFLSWAHRHFRRIPATTRPTLWEHSPTGRPMLFVRNISRIPDRLSMLRVRPSLVVSCIWLLMRLTCDAFADGIDKQDFKQIERGRYLTIAGDCAACHTLPGSGYDFAGGRAIETPFGQILTPNITPDPETGIGAWTDEEFVNALTKGTGRDGTRLYPAMPYTYYTKLRRDDALEIRAYLNTVPAVRNPVNPNQLPFPFNIRASLIGWKTLFSRR